jgi:hypothetical protein
VKYFDARIGKIENISTKIVQNFSTFMQSIWYIFCFLHNKFCEFQLRKQRLANKLKKKNVIAKIQTRIIKSFEHMSQSIVTNYWIDRQLTLILRESRPR